MSLNIEIFWKFHCLKFWYIVGYIYTCPNPMQLLHSYDYYFLTSATLSERVPYRNSLAFMKLCLHLAGQLCRDSNPGARDVVDKHLPTRPRSLSTGYSWCNVICFDIPVIITMNNNNLSSSQILKCTLISNQLLRIAFNNSSLNERHVSCNNVR